MQKVLICVLLMIHILSCSKNEVNDNPSKNKLLARIISTSENGTIELDSFVYDNERRIIKIITESDITTFQYSPQKIKTTRTSIANGSIQNINEISLDEQGRARTVNSFSKEGRLTSIMTTEYNEDGFVRKNTYSYPGNNTPLSREYTVKNDNYMNGKKLNNDILNSNFSYSYSSRLNTLAYSPASLFPSTNVFGEISKNLVTEFKETDLNGKILSHKILKYEFSKDGYPVKCTVTNAIDNKLNYVNEYLFK